MCWRNKEKPGPEYCNLKAQMGTVWLQYWNIKVWLKSCCLCRLNWRFCVYIQFLLLKAITLLFLKNCIVTIHSCYHFDTFFPPSFVYCHLFERSVLDCAKAEAEDCVTGSFVKHCKYKFAQQEWSPDAITRKLLPSSSLLLPRHVVCTSQFLRWWKKTCLIFNFHGIIFYHSIYILLVNFFFSGNKQNQLFFLFCALSLKGVLKEAWDLGTTVFQTGNKEIRIFFCEVQLLKTSFFSFTSKKVMSVSLSPTQWVVLCLKFSS